MKALLVVALICFFAPAAGAQEKPGDSWFVRTGFTAPYILPDSPFEPPANGASPATWVPDLTVEVGRQTNGSEQWHHLYGLPSYGVGVSLARFQSGTERGQPREAYLFFSWPFANLTDRMSVTTDFGMGLSWNWQHIDPATNTRTTVLGSDVNALIDWGFYLRYRSTARTSIYTGLDFTHRSNAGVVQPDKGINTLGPKIGLQYTFKPASSDPPSVPLPGFGPRWDLIVGGAGGLKNVVESRSPMMRQDFGVFHVTTELQSHFYRFGKLGVGTDLMYDGATGAQAEFVDGALRQSRADPTKRWAVGAYGGYEHVIGRFGAFIDVGYNAARAGTDASAPRLYQRFGWRYYPGERVWTMLAVRSIEGRKAEALEVGVGYRFHVSGSDPAR